MLKKRKKLKIPQKKKPKTKKINTSVSTLKTTTKIKITQKKDEKKVPVRKKTKIKKVGSKQRKKFRRVEVFCLLTGIRKLFLFKKATLLCKKLNFASIDIFKINFLSRDACKLLKQGFSEDEIKLKYNFKSDTSVSFDTIRRYIPSFNFKEKMLRKRKRKIINDIVDIQNSANKIVAEYNPVTLDLKNSEHMKYLTKDVCLRPDIHLNGDYSCNLCPHYALCVCSRRHWNKKLDKFNDKSNKKTKRL